MAERRKSPLEIETVEAHLCTVDLRLKILSQVPFFAGLAAEEIEAINQLFREQGFSAGESIYYAGDPARRLYVVADGRVKLLRHTESGKDVTLEVLTPGEFFGSLASLGDETFPDTAVALTATCALGIGREDFRAILETYPPVAVKMLEITASRLKAAHEMVRQLSAHSVERRIAYSLLKLGEKFGREDEVGLLIQLPLSRDDLAEMSGTTTESASRVMSQLQKKGLIHSGRQWVAIRDRAGLQALLGDELD